MTVEGTDRGTLLTGDAKTKGVNEERKQHKEGKRYH